MKRTIQTEALTRSFGPHRAVDNLDLRVEEGEVFGLLGPNGAGKTTTIRMLTTLLAPSSGVAQVCGFDVASRPAEVRKRIGYVMQTDTLVVNQLLTGRENAELEAGLRHVPRQVIRSRIEETLDVVGLLPHANRQIKEFSGGMRKRLDLACGLLHRPQLLILDEPSLGLDVQSRHRVWEHLKSLPAEGVTVLIATNYMDEADRLCDRLTIIDSGRAVVTGSPADLKRAVGADVIQVVTREPARLQAVVEGQPWVQKIVLIDSGDVHIYVGDASVALPALIRLSVEKDVGLERATYSQPTLDDVFLLHTGRELRELRATA